MAQSVNASVCIPTYNGAAFVAEAIRSVLEQSFADFELLIVDDGSTDSTLATVRSFADPRLRIYQNAQRLGIPGNWNRCLALARGEYVCLFHQDDVMLPENLERKVQVLDADPAIGLVHSKVELIIEDSASALASMNWMEDAADDFIVEGPHYFRKLLLAGNLICAPTVMAHRQKLLDLGGFDEKLGFTPDYEMWMKVCLDSRVAFLSQPLIRYRWHRGNASHAYRFERGVKEVLMAGRRALQYYVEQTGREEEGEVLTEAVTTLARLRRWAAELEQGKAWLEEQRTNWQRVAEEREQINQEQKAWIAELEQGKAWLEEQRTNWQRVAEEREQINQEQKARIAELEKGRAWLERGKAWLEEQQANWQRVAEARARVIADQEQVIREWQESFWGRISLRLRALRKLT
jgi:glycosyltransferase involved in cell wall biosynthesis